MITVNLDNVGNINHEDSLGNVAVNIVIQCEDVGDAAELKYELEKVIVDYGSDRVLEVLYDLLSLFNRKLPRMDRLRLARQPRHDAWLDRYRKRLNRN